MDSKVPKSNFNPLPNDKILKWPKFKAFRQKKINVTKQLEIVQGSVESTVGKGENAGYQHFLLQCFQKLSFSRPLKVIIVWSRVKKQ